MLLKRDFLVVRDLLEDLNLLDDPGMLVVRLTQTLEAFLRTPVTRPALEDRMFMSRLVQGLHGSALC